MASRPSRGTTDRSTLSTAASSVNAMCTRPAPSTAASAVDATLAPSGSSALALDSVRFQTVTASPWASRRSTIALPSNPVPRNATLFIVCTSGVSVESSR